MCDESEREGEENGESAMRDVVISAMIGERFLAKPAAGFRLAICEGPSRRWPRRFGEGPVRGPGIPGPGIRLSSDR